ncbi:hypothetical protein ACFVZH_08125 [Streptomyces sp. NPDC059534]|uniref:hypothetical protein n=1 Tax=Streptomyces sp. NPDC059534 TaxID=3346859 RepID=UPI0036BC7789
MDTVSVRVPIEHGRAPEEPPIERRIRARHWELLTPGTRPVLLAVRDGLQRQLDEGPLAAPPWAADLLLEPVPVEGCMICASFARVRLASQGVTRQNMNDQIGNHPHRRAADWRRP